MPNRYYTRDVIENNERLYKEMFNKRDVPFINHYESPKFTHPTEEEMSTLRIDEHVWRMGDRFFKLAYNAYADENLWWVIAWFNQTPTEAHVKIGDVVSIPHPLGRVLEYLEV